MFPDLSSINSSAAALEVDYPTVEKRLGALRGRALLDPLTAAPFIFDLYVFEKENGQQLEEATLDLVLNCELLASPHGVRIRGVRLDQPSGLLIENRLQKERKVLGITLEKCWPKKKRVANISTIAVDDLGYYLYDASKGAVSWGRRVRTAAATSDVAVNCTSEDRELVLRALALNEESWNGQDLWKLGGLLALVSEDLQADKEIVLAAVSHSLYTAKTLLHASPALKKDKELVLVAVSNNGLALEHASLELKGDKDVVMAAAKHGGSVLSFASKELQLDTEIWAAASLGSSFGSCSTALRDNKEFTLGALALGGDLCHASNTLIADDECRLATLHAGSLKFATSKQQADKGMVLMAVTKNGCALSSASEELKADREVVLAAVTQDGLALKFASAELQADEELMAVACT